jgi:hypothetical protein
MWDLPDMTNRRFHSPIHRFNQILCPSIWLASPLLPSNGSCSLVPLAVLTSSGIPVADAIFSVSRGFLDGQYTLKDSTVTAIGRSLVAYEAE